MFNYLFSTLIFIVVVNGCSVFVKTPEQTEKGKRVVCILYNATGFKTDVVELVSQSLTGKGCQVVSDDVNRAKYYSSSDYGAVVYMAEYWAWHIPRHAVKYFSRNKNSRNTLFVVTSGDPDVIITKPFDAVTSASNSDRVDPVSREIIEKLGRILKK